MRSFSMCYRVGLYDPIDPACRPVFCGPIFRECELAEAQAVVREYMANARKRPGKWLVASVFPVVTRYQSPRESVK